MSTGNVEPIHSLAQSTLPARLDNFGRKPITPDGLLMFQAVTQLRRDYIRDTKGVNVQLTCAGAQGGVAEVLLG